MLGAGGAAPIEMSSGKRKIRGATLEFVSGVVGTRRNSRQRPKLMLRTDRALALDDPDLKVLSELSTHARQRVARYFVDQLVDLPKARLERVRRSPTDDYWMVFEHPVHCDGSGTWSVYVVIDDPSAYRHLIDRG
jgi:hypothetical protein